MRLWCALLIGFAGCGQGPIPPDVSDLSVEVIWNPDEISRSIQVRVRDPDLPCSGTETSGFLFETGVRCVSAPWELTIDGVPVQTDPVTCHAAYDSILGPVPKRCERNSSAWVPLPDALSPDVEIVAATELEETRLVIHAVRTTYAFVEEAPVRGFMEPGIARVDVDLVCDSFFAASFTPPGGGEPIRGAVEALSDRSGSCDHRRLAFEFRPDIEVEAAYTVRVLAEVELEGAIVAVPIEGTITVLADR